CVVLLIVGLAFALRVRGPEPQEVRLDITTPPTSDSISLAISPDGRTVAFVGNQQGKSILMLRALDSTAVRPTSGTDRPVFPFLSPGGRSIGFFADGKLKRVDITGGSPQVLAVASSPRGGTWNADGTIVFGPTVGPLYRVSASGGDSTRITRVEASLNSHRYPQFLPDGQHFLFFGAGDPSVKGVYLGSLDGSTPRRLVSSDTTGAYHTSGFLLFIRQGTLFAQKFDLKRFEVRSDPVPIADNIAIEPTIFAAAFATANGAIVVRSGGSLALRRLVWFDRTGKDIGAVSAPDAGGPLDPELSLDEKRVALVRNIEGNSDVWIIDTLKGVPSRFTSDPGLDTYPVWSPDGQWLAFGSTRKSGVYDLYRKLSVNTGNEEALLESSQSKVPTDWSPDGEF